MDMFALIILVYSLVVRRWRIGLGFFLLGCAGN